MGEINICKNEGCNNKAMEYRRLCKKCLSKRYKIYYENNKDKYSKYYKYEKTNKPRGRPKKEEEKTINDNILNYKKNYYKKYYILKKEFKRLCDIII